MYDPSVPLIKWTKVHMESDKNSILRSPTQENTFMKIDWHTFFKNMLVTTSIHQKARIAVATSENIRSTKIKELPDSIDPTRPPKSYREAMLGEDATEFSGAFMKEYMDFKKRGVSEMVRITKGMKHDNTDGVQDHQN